MEIGKDFIVSHGYIDNHFDVHEWARPNSWSKLPESGGLELEGTRLESS